MSEAETRSGTGARIQARLAAESEARTGFHSALYHGSVFHSRRDRFARRRFQYSVVTAVLDLDELPELHRRLRLFSHNRPNLYSFYDRDYRDGGAAGGARAAASALFEREGLAAPHSLRLVTNLRIAGYVFNPVSYVLGYDAGGALTAVIAEVNNTYGGSKRYVLGPAQRLPRQLAPDARPGFRHARELFVSPFLHGPASYDFHFDAPLDGERLAIRMNVHALEDGAGAAAAAAMAGAASAAAASGEGAASAAAASGLSAGPAAGAAPRSAPPDGPRIFLARLEGERQELSDRALLAAAARYPLMTVQVIGLIHWQALKLHLLGAPYRRPGPDHRPLPNVDS